MHRRQFLATVTAGTAFASGCSALPESVSLSDDADATRSAHMSAQTNTKNTLLVGTGAEFETVSDAYSNISDAAPGNRYTIFLTSDVIGTETIRTKSHVDVHGNGYRVTVRTDDDSDGVVFDDVVDSQWRGLRVVRDGTTNSTQIRAGTVTGTKTDQSLRIRDCVFENRITTDADNCYGFVISHESSPSLNGCRLVAPDGGNRCYGCAIEGSGSPVLDACKIKGGAGAANCVGAFIEGGASPIIRDCSIVGGHGRRGCSGMWVTGAASPIIKGCEIVSGLCPRSLGANIIGNASPSISQTTIRGYHISSDSYTYSAADGGRFKPGQRAYMVHSLAVFVDESQSKGSTVDIGSKPGSSDVASSIPLDTFGWQYVDYERVEMSAGAPLYATPSTEVPDGAFRVSYSILSNQQACYGIRMNTNGYAKVVNSYVSANGNSDALRIEGDKPIDWLVVESTLETADPQDRYAISAPFSLGRVPVRGCTTVGPVKNVKVSG